MKASWSFLREQAYSHQVLLMGAAHQTLEILEIDAVSGRSAFRCIVTESVRLVAAGTFLEGKGPIGPSGEKGELEAVTPHDAQRMLRHFFSASAGSLLASPFAASAMDSRIEV